MCLIAFAIGTHPDLPLLLAGNRDEFFDRPTEVLHRWPDAPGIWAGRDARDRGTWLGISEAGRVAWLTNVRSAQAGAGARSRGELATRWLRGGEHLDAWLSDLDPAAYGGFNLVVGELGSGHWTWLSNRDPGRPHTEAATGLHRQDLAPGVYGLSNATLDTPWPKTRQLKTALRDALPRAMNADPDDADWTRPLQQALADTRVSEPVDLPQTGVDAEVERALSSAFVRMPGRGYGTRSSLILGVRRSVGRSQSGPLQAHLLEWTHGPDGWSAQGPAEQRLAC